MDSLAFATASSIGPHVAGELSSLQLGSMTSALSLKTEVFPQQSGAGWHRAEDGEPLCSSSHQPCGGRYHLLGSVPQSHQCALGLAAGPLGVTAAVPTPSLGVVSAGLP